MFSLLAEFTRNLSRPVTIIVMDEDAIEAPRRYSVAPKQLWATVALLAVALVLVGGLLVLTPPLRFWVMGRDAEVLQQQAEAQALRLAALQDSLAVQDAYMQQLRGLITGQFDAAPAAPDAAPEPAAVSGELAAVAADPPAGDWSDHAQPALPVAKLTTTEAPRVQTVAASNKYVRGLTLPALSPVNGLLTRGFDARAGHFAIDIAVEEGTTVRAIGEGYVILADWTHDGGYAIAVQHADGYVSVYKHNRRLLKRAGDRVRSREPIAVSGNSGEITTGPHVHFELWQDGLAQDPSVYLIR